MTSTPPLSPSTKNHQPQKVEPSDLSSLDEHSNNNNTPTIDPNSIKTEFIDASPHLNAHISEKEPSISRDSQEETAADGNSVVLPKNTNQQQQQQQEVSRSNTNTKHEENGKKTPSPSASPTDAPNTRASPQSSTISLSNILTSSSRSEDIDLTLPILAAMNRPPQNQSNNSSTPQQQQLQQQEASENQNSAITSPHATTTTTLNENTTNNDSVTPVDSPTNSVHSMQQEDDETYDDTTSTNTNSSLHMQYNFVSSTTNRQREQSSARDNKSKQQKKSHADSSRSTTAEEPLSETDANDADDAYVHVSVTSLPTAHRAIQYANGARFDGEVELENELRHGTGTLKYANGDLYEGGWVEGKRDGPTLCEFVDDERNLRSLVGYFKDDVITSADADITYTDGSRYFGQVKPLFQNNSLKEMAGKRLEKFVRHGKGQIFFCNGDSYSGTFHMDRMQGFGVFMGEEGQYYGNFVNNFKQGYGVMMFRNGTFYRGNWKGDKKYGKGDMIMSNGCAITGVWKDNQITKAQYITLEESDIPKWIPICSLNLLRETIISMPDDKFSYAHEVSLSVADQQLVGATKWIGFFELNSQLFEDFTSKLRETLAYKCFLEYKSQQTIPTGEKRSSKKRSGSFFNTMANGARALTGKIGSDDIPPSTSNKPRSSSANSATPTSDPFTKTSIVTNLERFLIENCETGELGKIIAAFDSMFHCRYRDITTKTAKRQKPLALDDFFSFLNSFHTHVARALTPDILSIYGSDQLLILLKNQVLSRLYKQLFEIYKFLYHQKDSHMRFKLKSLKSITMKEIGCPVDSIPLDEDYSIYQNAVKMLKRLPAQTNPQAKFKILKKTDDAIGEAYTYTVKRNRELYKQRAAEENRDTSHLKPIFVDLGANTKLPILIYIFILANIAHPHSELQFMSDFFDRETATSVYSLRYANYEQVCDYINRIDPSIRDENGEVIPVDRITERVQRNIDDIFGECIRKKTAPPKMLWLSSVFISIASVPLLERNHVLIFEQFFTLFDKYFKYAKVILAQASVSLRRTSIDIQSLEKSKHGSRTYVLENRQKSQSLPVNFGADQQLQSAQDEVEDVEPSNESPSNDEADHAMVTTSSLGFTEMSLRRIRKENQKIRFSYALVVERPFPSFVYFKFANRLEEAIGRFE